MVRAYAMPVRTELAAKVGPRLWRKTILRPGHISKNGVELDVDRRYMEDLVASFKAGAKDQVQFVLANSRNQHDESPERYAGSIVDLTITKDDRLEATFAVTAKGDQLLTENPELGASPSLEHSFARADGRAGGPTLLHVCGTLDPEISRLGSWSRADLSAEYEVLDLTAAELTPAPETPADGGSTPPLQEGRTVPELKTADEETLAQLRALLPALTKLAQVDTGGDAGDEVTDDATDEVTADDLDAIATGTDVVDITDHHGTNDVAPEVNTTPELIAASAERDEALELANSRLDALEVQNARLQRQLDEENYIKERDHLAREFGVPPKVTDLCKQWLTGSNRVELSAGKVADPGDAIRKALKQFAQIGPVDLSAATGTGHELGGVEAQYAEDEAFLAAQHARYGRKDI